MKKAKTKKKTKTKKSRRAAKRKVKAKGKVTLNFKVPGPHAEAIKRKANKWTKGNVTALVVGCLKYADFHGPAIRNGEYRATTRAAA